MRRSIRRVASGIFVAGTVLVADTAFGACEEKDFLCETKTVCARPGPSSADWFPRPPRPHVPRPRPSRPPLP